LRIAEVVVLAVEQNAIGFVTLRSDCGQRPVRGKS